jgi:hypothetical protein
MDYWNSQSTTTLKVGAGIPVWAKLPERRIAGGKVKNTLVLGEKVSAGTPVYFDYVNKEAKFLKCWEIKTSTVNGANTDVVLKKTFLTPKLYPATVVMVMPSTMTGTGKALASNGTVTETDTEIAVSFVTANMDDLTVGLFLVESSGVAGSAKSIYCQPTNLAIEDTIGGDQNQLGIPVGMRYVFENCIPAMPAVVKANIANVEWEYFNQTT